MFLFNQKMKHYLNWQEYTSSDSNYSVTHLLSKEKKRIPFAKILPRKKVTTLEPSPTSTLILLGNTVKWLKYSV